jgi:hypothetical protein
VQGNTTFTNVQKDIEMSDQEYGLLVGFGFSITYAVVGLFVGRLTDLYSRTLILFGGLVVWSLSTAATGNLSSPPLAPPPSYSPSALFANLFASRSRPCVLASPRRQICPRHRRSLLQPPCLLPHLRPLPARKTLHSQWHLRIRRLRRRRPCVLVYRPQLPIRLEGDTPLIPPPPPP